MAELGPAMPFYLLILVWMAKVVFLALLCSLLGWLGIRVMDALTPRIHHRERVGREPISIGLFIAGFFIFIGLVIHGAVTAPAAVGGPLLGYIFAIRRLGLIAVSFFISLLLGLALFNLIDRLTPKIPFIKIDEQPIAVGVFIFGYLVFFGLIIHAALLTPL